MSRFLQGYLEKCQKIRIMGEFGMNTKSRSSNPITEGVIWKQLLIFFFPIMVGTLFQQLYNTVDAVIVGRFVGKQALASVGGSARCAFQLCHWLFYRPVRPEPV